MLKVIKRDGRKVPFNQNKIIDAVLAAFKEIDRDISEYALIKAGNISDYILEYAETENRELTIEEIQNLIEKGLMSTKRKDVARAYITYRNERTKERERKSDMVKMIAEKISASKVENQNANMDERSFGGRMGAVNSEVMKSYALNYCMSEMAKNNHLNNEVYIHDLDHYAVGDHNCLSIPFDKLLADGFNTRQTDVRPAQSVNTAFQLVAVIFQLQSLQQFGGVSATHLDWTMVPYVRKSFYKHYIDGLEYIAWDVHDAREPMRCFLRAEIKPEEVSIYDNIYKTSNMKIPYKCVKAVYEYALEKTEREVHQAVEGMYHNLNTLQSRSGNQLPFTSVNYGTCTMPEGRMVTKALLEVSIKGIGKLHKTSIFPCGIFQCMKGVNRKPGDPNYDLFRLALRSTAQRLYPNYANVDWGGNAGYDVNDPRTYFSTMGRRKL